MTALGAAFDERPDIAIGSVLITEVRFISNELAEVRFTSDDHPMLGTSIRDGDQWIVNLGIEPV